MVAPALDKVKAVEKPIPLLAPVMSMTLSLIILYYHYFVPRFIHIQACLLVREPHLFTDLPLREKERETISENLLDITNITETCGPIQFANTMT
jgi:hypothetical protein